MCEIKLNKPTVSLYSEKLILKILFEHNQINKLIRRNDYYSDDVAHCLGLPEDDVLLDKLENENDGNSRSLFRSTAIQLLKKRYKEIKTSECVIPENLQIAYENLSKIQQYLDLTEEELAILQLSMHIRVETELESTLDLLH